jgi:hypothetical protein
VSAGTAGTGAKGHFLPPEWDGTDSILKRYEAVAYDPDNPAGTRDTGHTSSR